MTSKFYGVVGYSMGSTEIAPGVMDDVIVERKYYGDINRVGVKSRIGENVLPDLDITHEFRIMADAYAYENFFAMRYITWSGVNWTIKQIEVQRPRLVLRVGGVYNGPTLDTSANSGESDD